ncbi:ABC-type multidrug transport system, ATPase and permease component [Planctomicrobium piriforme]|uniref:ABC-type multidrug transport system, ATPase and permease component n=2 Tax=Planctomicrobium piriforme TaxID=1576369 RepID=A0A1I3C4Q4_9PLAN|nr:ABC-type multidrug transport system, ATPase and permease component [Planctomicrobium piriforme]
MRRLVTRRSWLDRNGSLLIVWMSATAVCVIVLLLLVTLLVDMLVTRGVLESNRVHGLAPPGTEVEAGLWVQVVRFGQLPAWAWLQPFAASIPILQTTSGALSILILLTLLTVVCFSYSRNRARVYSARSARDLATWLRSSIHRQTLRLGPSDLTGHRYQTALAHFVDDAESIREAAAEWRWRFVRSVILLPVLTICILAIDVRLGLECLIPTVACWFVYRYERQQGSKKRQISESHADTEVRFLAEALKQTRLVRGYSMEDFEQTLFNRHLERMTDQSRTGRRLERAALSTARLVTWSGLTLVILLVALRVTSAVSPLPLANAVAMLVALGLFAIELNSWDRLLQLRTELEVSGDRIYRYLDEIPEVGQAVGAKFIEPVTKSIVLEAVHYQQLGHQLLRGVDLRIEAKTEVALVSLDPLLPRTVAYLLPRFIEPTRGRVMYDGEDIAWGTLESIRTETLYVGAEDPVLSGSILDNILCGDSRYSVQDAIEAAKLVHAHTFISRLPQGYETMLGEHGEQLDAGAMFRLGLARAALRDPAVMIIEEPKGGLDEDTKSLIDDAYQRLSATRTMIYLPGRLSTSRRCDQVVLLHDGIVEAVGTHQELTKMSEVFRHWDYLTFNTFSRRSRRLQQV